MDCREIIIKWLHDNGHDGLCEPDTECGCGLDDFAPCGDGPYPKCKAAKARTLLEHEYVGDCGPGEIAYFVSPNDQGKGRPPQATVPLDPPVGRDAEE